VRDDGREDEPGDGQPGRAKARRRARPSTFPHDHRWPGLAREGGRRLRSRWGLERHLAVLRMARGREGTPTADPLTPMTGSVGDAVSRRSVAAGSGWW